MIREMVEGFREYFQQAGYDDVDRRTPTMQRVYDIVRDRWGRGTNPYPMGTVLHDEFNALARDELARLNRRYLALPEVQAVRAASKRKVEQPRVKPRFQSLHDIRLRLSGTCIFVGPDMYYVNDIYELDNDYLLSVTGRDGKNRRVWYSNELIDLRSMEPQYVNLESGPYFVFRPPMRSQRQGMCDENLRAKRPGDRQYQRPGLLSIVKGFGTQSVPWSAEYARLMNVEGVLPTLRLSKDVAFYRERDRLKAEYRGRLLGFVNDDTVYLDDSDLRRPWIQNALRDVNCSYRAQ